MKLQTAHDDQTFSEARNKAVIEDTIRRHEANVRNKQKEFDQELGERTDAAASYLKHLASKGTPIEKYFGRRELVHLQARKIEHALLNKGTYGT